MANRYFREKVLTGDARQVQIAGSISLSSAAAVAATNFNHLVASVAKTATGEYTITLTDKYVALRSVTLTLESSDVTTALTVKSADVTSAKTIVINTSTAGSVADVDTASKIHVNIVLKDSTAK